MLVGLFLIFFAGTHRLASKIWQKLGLEWLCWLFEIPRCVRKRYIMVVMKFISPVIHEGIEF